MKKYDFELWEIITIARESIGPLPSCLKSINLPLRSEAEMKAAEQEAKVRTLERQLEDARSKISEVEDSRMERSEAKSEQVEMLLNDLEASNQRAAVAERELEAARERLDIAAKERASAAAANR